MFETGFTEQYPSLLLIQKIVSQSENSFESQAKSLRTGKTTHEFCLSTELYFQLCNLLHSMNERRTWMMNLTETIPAVDMILALLGMRLIRFTNTASAKWSNLLPNCCDMYLQRKRTFFVLDSSGSLCSPAKRGSWSQTQKHIWCLAHHVHSLVTESLTCSRVDTYAIEIQASLTTCDRKSLLDVWKLSSSERNNVGNSSYSAAPATSSARTAFNCKHKKIIQLGLFSRVEQSNSGFFVSEQNPTAFLKIRHKKAAEDKIFQTEQWRTNGIDSCFETQTLFLESLAQTSGFDAICFLQSYSHYHSAFPSPRCCSPAALGSWSRDRSTHGRKITANNSKQNCAQQFHGVVGSLSMGSRTLEAAKKLALRPMHHEVLPQSKRKCSETRKSQKEIHHFVFLILCFGLLTWNCLLSNIETCFALLTLQGKNLHWLLGRLRTVWWTLLRPRLPELQLQNETKMSRWQPKDGFWWARNSKSYKRREKHQFRIYRCRLVGRGTGKHQNPLEI